MQPPTLAMGIGGGRRGPSTATSLGHSSSRMRRSGTPLTVLSIVLSNSNTVGRRTSSFVITACSLATQHDSFKALPERVGIESGDPLYSLQPAILRIVPEHFSKRYWVSDNNNRTTASSVRDSL